ncbi:hypothetical protein CAOG_04558 [Capsaspora owczarzaki ATCC 30864]|uniref:Uncharacterized protein n=1 Tax=Capsaspora owczarzaki (strain ATCC 30864) TaxID=595528 RepID=A0A0D2WQB2_CAPO3|nr:hypothetical protein CAOG_04558 [Capsaspora owczarzaki ATCC 30864]KJE93820.1 hypothetical protein CAOG_004558 [Capsaspora owczarzaki ATCC 30864]|eukprot:XP_004347305.1 hypothetical protein CAOG_04558 [Capsaspora owczarzaki ATCC 30864]
MGAALKRLFPGPVFLPSGGTELEYIVWMLEWCARANQCTCKKRAGETIVAMALHSRVSGDPHRQFAGSLPLQASSQSAQMQLHYPRAVTIDKRREELRAQDATHDAQAELAKLDDDRIAKDTELQSLAKPKRRRLPRQPRPVSPSITAATKPSTARRARRAAAEDDSSSDSDSQQASNIGHEADESGYDSDDNERVLQVTRTDSQSDGEVHFALKALETREIADNIRPRPFRAARRLGIDALGDINNPVNKRVRLDTEAHAVEPPPMTVNLTELLRHQMFVPASSCPNPC